MAEQGARMNRLIDDLLSLSRIEMVEHQAPSDTVDLAVLLPRIVAGYEPRLAGGGTRILVEIDAGHAADHRRRRPDRPGVAEPAG
jgi:two-component system phosphate regulon sensor histidine kinase PhoR